VLHLFFELSATVFMIYEGHVTVISFLFVCLLFMHMCKSGKKNERIHKKTRLFHLEEGVSVTPETRIPGFKNSVPNFRDIFQFKDKLSYSKKKAEAPMC